MTLTQPIIYLLERRKSLKMDFMNVSKDSMLCCFIPNAYANAHVMDYELGKCNLKEVLQLERWLD